MVERKIQHEDFVETPGRVYTCKVAVLREVLSRGAVVLTDVVHWGEDEGRPRVAVP